MNNYGMYVFQNLIERSILLYYEWLWNSTNGVLTVLVFILTLSSDVTSFITDGHSIYDVILYADITA